MNRLIRKIAFTGLYALLAANLLFSGGACADSDSAESPSDPSRPRYTLPDVPENTDVLVITRVVWRGNECILSPELTEYVAPFLNRSIRAVELEQLRQSVTQLYVARGYVNSGAMISADSFRDGILTVDVIEGKITETRVSGADRLNPTYVTSRLVRNGEVLHVGTLEERIRLLLTDPLIENIDARLLPITPSEAKSPRLGEAVLDVTAKTARPYGLSLSASNYLAPAVGSYFGAIDGWVRNLTTWGDTLTATVRNSHGSNNYAIGWDIPILAGRTMLNLNFARGTSSVIEEPLDALDIESFVESKEIGISHPIIDSARRKLVLGMAYGERENRTTLAGEPFSFVAGEQTGRTVVRDWHVFQDYLQRFENHAIAFRSTFIWGNNNVTGEPPAPGQPSHNFFAWLGQGQSTSAILDGRAELIGRLTYQYARDSLVPLERFSVGGRYTVRGYRENQLVRDSGYFATAELQYALIGDSRSKRRLKIVPFVDFGAAANRDASKERLVSMGLGTIWAFDKFDGELFYAKRLKTPTAEGHGDLQDHGIHLQVRFHVF